MNMLQAKKRCAEVCIGNILKFTLPIGWDEVGVIATVLAVIVALFANKKATEELKSALKMQEQSKNVSLLDKRIELAEKIQSGKSISALTLQVLFNDEIVKHYKAWQNHLSEKTYAEHDLEIFFELSRVSDGAGGCTNDVWHIIRKFEADMSRSDCPQETVDEYMAFCAENVVWQKTGENEELTPYNHAEISERIGKATINAKGEQTLTLQLIEKFITDSIEQIGDK